MFRLTLLLLFMVPNFCFAESSRLTVRYTFPDTPVFKHRNLYFQDLLKLALDRAGTPYTMVPITRSMGSAARNIRFINTGLYDVSWLHTDTHKESHLIPIRVPMFKGLIGWRVMLVHKNNADMFARANSVNDLQGLKIGQGTGWPDNRILQAAGLNVQPVAVFNDLFSLLHLKQIDALPRSVIEVQQEMAAFSDSDIAIDKHLALWYPSVTYLFVAKSNQALADIISLGLNRAVDDGSFEQTFQRYFGEQLASLKLAERKVIKLGNPELPAKTPVAIKKYWYQP